MLLLVSADSNHIVMDLIPTIVSILVAMEALTVLEAINPLTTVVDVQLCMAAEHTVTYHSKNNCTTTIKYIPGCYRMRAAGSKSFQPSKARGDRVLRKFERARLAAERGEDYEVDEIDNLEFASPTAALIRRHPTVKIVS